MRTLQVGADVLAAMRKRHDVIDADRVVMRELQVGIDGLFADAAAPPITLEYLAIVNSLDDLCALHPRV